MAEASAASGARYRNPILPGFYPDPSICRVGETFYLVTSSFHYYPGLPIFRSRDLVHWTQISHVLDRSSQLALDGCPPSWGLFAPTIRHHDGRFYIICTHVGGGGNFVVTATDPAGPWSDPHWIEGAEGIDPSLFFDDDGRCYYVGNGDPAVSQYEGHHTIWQQEFDVATYRLVGEKRVLVDGGTDISKQPIWIEGPHLYKIEGRYYIFAAEGGTAEEHSVVVFRSEHVTGPYVSFAGNPILTHRDQDPDAETYPITCTGHADIVQTERGDWWMVLLGCRPYPPASERCFNTGRETFLAPVTWHDGWPLVGDGSGRLAISYAVPDLPADAVEDDHTSTGVHFRDHFDSRDLHPRWNAIRTPPSAPSCTLDASRSRLRFHLRPERLGERSHPSFLGARQRGPAFTAEAAIEFRPRSANEIAGLAIVQNDRAFYALVIVLSGSQRVVRLLKSDARTDPAAPELRVEAPISGTRLRLRVRADGGRYRFSCAAGVEDFMPIGEVEDGSFLSTRYAGGFVGTYVGMYASSQGEPSSNHADFDWFAYATHDTDVADPFGG